MTKKKPPQTIEECDAEMELTQKKIRQYENRAYVAHVLKPLRRTTRPIQAAQNSALRARRVSEKAGRSELEQLRFSHDFACFCPNIRKNHCFRCLKTVVF